MTINDIPVTVVRKRIRSLQMRVCPPEGEVRISAPFILPEETIRDFVIRKSAWIKRHQQRLRSAPRPVPVTWEDGEEHLFFGEPHRLRVIETSGAPCVIRREGTLELYLRPGAGVEERRETLERWSRKELEARGAPLLAAWQTRMGVSVSSWGIKKMTTRWGSCNTRTRRIWLNLELVKRAPACLEFIVVHELAHLLERRHNAHFYAIMDRFLPAWRTCDQELSPSKRRRR